MKQANVIIYKPGYGGHFISMILSLSPSTIPWIRGQNFRFVFNAKTPKFNSDCEWIHEKFYNHTPTGKRINHITFKNIHTNFS